MLRTNVNSAKWKAQTAACKRSTGILPAGSIIVVSTNQSPTVSKSSKMTIESRMTIFRLTEKMLCKRS